MLTKLMLSLFEMAFDLLARHNHCGTHKFLDLAESDLL